MDNFSDNFCQSLKLKFSALAVSEILKYREEVDRELDGIERAEERIGELEREGERLKDKGLKVAETLSERRKKGSDELTKKVVKELSDLGMKKAIFEVKMERLNDISAKGSDKVEFLLSSNPGEATKPLSKIASGGELSRIMLALKKVLANGEEFPNDDWLIERFIHLTESTVISEKDKSVTAGYTQSFRHGESITIPKGKFLYGEYKVEEEIVYDYKIDVFPVTNKQYKEFLLLMGIRLKTMQKIAICVYCGLVLLGAMLLIIQFLRLSVTRRIITVS